MKTMCVLCLAAAIFLSGCTSAASSKTAPGARAHPDLRTDVVPKNFRDEAYDSAVVSGFPIIMLVGGPYYLCKEIFGAD